MKSRRYKTSFLADAVEMSGEVNPQAWQCIMNFVRSLTTFPNILGDIVEISESGKLRSRRYVSDYMVDYSVDHSAHEVMIHRIIQTNDKDAWRQPS